MIFRVSERILQNFLVNSERVPIFFLEESLVQVNPLLYLYIQSSFNRVDLYTGLLNVFDVVCDSSNPRDI